MICLLIWRKCLVKSLAVILFDVQTTSKTKTLELSKRDENDRLIVSANGMSIIPFIEQKQNTTLALGRRAISLNSVTLFARISTFYFLREVHTRFVVLCRVALHLCWSILCVCVCCFSCTTFLIGISFIVRWKMKPSHRMQWECLL